MYRTKYLTDILLINILNNNWPDSEIKEATLCQKKGGNPSNGGFSSDYYKLKLIIEDKEQHLKECFFFIKVSPDVNGLSTLYSPDKLFSNETIWYEKLVKEYENIMKNAGLESDNYHLWPKSFLCDRFSNDLSVIVVEDLQKDDYRLSESTISLDESHAILALKKLGILHALGYTLKFQKPDLYESIIGEIQETFNFSENTFDELLKATTERGIKRLRLNPEYKEFVKCLDERIGESPFNYQATVLQKHKNNNIILCHGDFLRNNVLFKYDKLGEVNDAIIIDFATIRESSPGLDLALFIYMSVDEKILNDRYYLKKLLSVYHATVVSTLQLLNGPADPWNGDINNLEKEFGSYALYAYNICSFFMGIMVAEGLDFEESIKLSPEERLELNITNGGELITQRLNNMLISFKDNDYHRLF